MKRWITCVLAVMLMLSIMATPALATGIGYTDNNGDGICDNREQNCGRKDFIDNDGDGICDHRGQNKGFGLCHREDDGTIFPCKRQEHRPSRQRKDACPRANYKDENNDGICDNLDQEQGNFIDKDGDGICDNRGQSNCNGNGQGRQRGRKI